ncbi:MAG: PEP-CTERM sorting domain-containing protein [Phycisphaerales bacterium]
MSSKVCCGVLLTAGLAAILSQSTLAAAVNVPGTSNLWLAGMPDGTDAGDNDFAPGQSPVLVDLAQFGGALTLRFAASGFVTNGGGGTLFGPRGDTAQISEHVAGAQFGKSGLLAPLNGLIAVFLDDSDPTLGGTPADLDFTSALSRDFASLSPLLKQTFYIGDGMDSLSQVQDFIIPAGATRLYLGTMDGFEWNNNEGSFDVTISVPSPGAVALGVAGLVVAASRRRR